MMAVMLVSWAHKNSTSGACHSFSSMIMHTSQKFDFYCNHSSVMKKSKEMVAQNKVKTVKSAPKKLQERLHGGLCRSWRVSNVAACRGRRSTAERAGKSSV